MLYKEPIPLSNLVEIKKGSRCHTHVALGRNVEVWIPKDHLAYGQAIRDSLASLTLCGCRSQIITIRGA